MLRRFLLRARVPIWIRSSLTVYAGEASAPVSLVLAFWILHFGAQGDLFMLAIVWKQDTVSVGLKFDYGLCAVSLLEYP